MALKGTAMLLGRMFSTLKNAIFRLIRAIFLLFSTDCTKRLPEGPVLVLAPHPDDETLGCGAAIARFCAEGRKVRVIIVTDGRASARPALISPDELAEIRRKEVLKAMDVLGVAREEIVFWDYPDGETAMHADKLAGDVALHVQGFAPGVVFTASRFDKNPDHRALAAVVERLQSDGKIQCRVFQYPIWAGAFHWLWQTPCVLLYLLRSGRGWKIKTGAYLEKKRSALGMYASQFGNLTGETGRRKMTNGFAERFCNGWELFFESKGKRST
jgi:LmbE family N-acetylglucosaminyl deacetylase